MAKERGVMKILWNSFISSLKPRFFRRKLIGEDYYGTKYYEEEIRTSSRKKSARSFEPVNKDDFMQELPAEWESWLRHRRKEPPTREEVEANYRLAMTKKENSAALQEKYSQSKELSTQSTQSTTSSFPVYEDYKNFGSSYKPKSEY
ncbi:NADH dehydrogenase [ubiquinone] 1 alpha subcomplex assembly factor 2 [Odontomachus brunneus]|uniref:NADH dehydrogenase [ubiquinone] 1 alpha subcomplex assembly factor 2 n=1 Tax=Odontomachus brunneus TaxID=486640 RepID=UPI0013F1F163|nr:NADH dehydrogenase [ubiquinone] 1 alpha subcomplex assembly factor 2 [Odontomachus brunneus]